MAEPASAAGTTLARQGVIGRALRAIGERTSICFRVNFSDGSSFQNRDGTPVATLTFRTAAAELRIWLFGHVGLLESYFDGSLEVDGDFGLAFRAGMDTAFDKQSNPLVALRNAWHEFRFSNRTIAQARANADAHYALGTAFYRQWLDAPYMMYTCAYWKEGTRTLEEAQQNKMEHVCRKIELRPGESFVDIGCGWGGFMYYAWERCRAIGTGVNITHEQVAAVRSELARRGLAGTLKVIEADFREIPGTYDKCVSIGVLEHAGRDQLAEVVRAHATCLKPGGLGMLHFIGHVGKFDTEFYIRKHIFPGGWIPSLAETIAAMEKAGLEILDIENLRRHYALTLDAWGERFERHWPEIQALSPAMFNEKFRRKWRAYLYSCAEMFRSPKGCTHLFQITYSRGNTRYYPMSRAHLYAAAECPA
ncbi:MAG TPA: cyclopropane-fatty-acyl-phospholipid synthase family protein [Burkholderiales bacterium]|nr:cyclopropane-fatty-acyl-phospholipid synthase family protein [Burkholderiales bacterium]